MNKVKFYVISLCFHIFLFLLIGAFTLRYREIRQVPVIWELAGHEKAKPIPSLDIAAGPVPEVEAISSDPQSASSPPKTNSTDGLRKLNVTSDPVVRAEAISSKEKNTFVKKTDSAEVDTVHTLQQEFPKSIMFAKRPNMKKILGLDRRLKNYFLQDATPPKMSTESVIAQRLSAIKIKYQLHPDNRSWRYRILGASTEVAAFYAAKAADKPVAMVAVATYSLTVGSIGESMRAMGKALWRRAKTPRGLYLDDREIDIMEQVWMHEKVSVRDLYLALSSERTVKTLQKKLKDLVDRGLLVYRGKGHKAMYSAQVDPDQVMNTMIAKLSFEDVKAKARIFRLAEIRADGLQKIDKLSFPDFHLKN